MSTDSSKPILLGLPCEIRLRIWRFVYSDTKLVVWCDEDNFQRDALSETEAPPIRSGSLVSFCRNNGVPMTVLLALPFTCKITYQETLTAMLGTIVFHFHLEL